MQLIRITFIVLGLVIYLHSFAPHLLGVRRERFENLAIGVGSLVLLVGAWSRSPIGWYAGLVFCVYNVIDISARWRGLLPASTPARVKVGTGMWLTLNGVLVVVLLTDIGRRTFNLMAL
jgi:hypothetical protein